MELIRGLHNIHPRHQGCAATIGNFDGVHLGHQKVINAVCAEAQKSQRPSCVISFEPLPVEFFAPSDKTPTRLTHLREKYRALQQQNVQQLLVLPFDQKLANTTAADFIQHVLIDGLKVKHLLVGDDFRFGHNREGDFSRLKLASDQHGFTLQRSDTHRHTNERISSTRIRNLLLDGNLDTAATLLGRHYALQGRVEYGAQLGRTIGFPTANIGLRNRKLPLRGVFAVRVSIEPELREQSKPTVALSGIANLGKKPTVDGTRVTLEVHLLDYSADLYGKRLRVEFLHRIRDEKKFDSFDELKQAIANDETSARQWFALNQHL